MAPDPLFDPLQQHLQNKRLRPAYFINIDGGLLEHTPAPNMCSADAELIDLLRRLARMNDGAVALVSGRSICALDALVEPLVLPIAGLHGFERRSASGEYFRGVMPPGDCLHRARDLLRQSALRTPDFVFEDKRFALALHYARAPSLEGRAVREMATISRLCGAGLQMKRGNRVIELCPRGSSLENAIEAFMRESPFHRRIPVCLADSAASDGLFAWVNAIGGISVGVHKVAGGAARHTLESVNAARDWLRRLARPQVCVGAGR